MSADEAAANQPPATKPILRVVKGDLAPEELAALVAVIAARNAAAAHAAANTKPKVRSAWNNPVNTLPGPHHVARGAWRQSAFGR